MQYTAPHYYKEFHCTGGDCPDTCCAGWQIQIDPSSLKKYKRIKGALGNRLKNEINWKESCFRQYSGRCAFLNDEDLCDLYLEGGGEKAFCRTCRTYPRHIEEFEGLREISLSLSCPVAADLILNCREPVRFLHAENPDREESYDEFDFFLFTKLMDTRSLIFRILQDRSHPIKLRVFIILALAHDLQERIDRNALYDVDNLLERYSSEITWSWFENRLLQLNQTDGRNEKRGKTMQSLFSLFDHLEVLREDWTSYLNNACKILGNAPVSDEETERCFHKLFSDTAAEQLLVYFVFTYFCGAVYNGNAYGKIKFSIASMILIRELTRAEWLASGDIQAAALEKAGSDINSSAFIRTACRYAREVEHSDYNKTTMERLLSDNVLFGLEELFSVL